MNKTIITIIISVLVGLVASLAYFLILAKPTTLEFVKMKGLPDEVEFFNKDHYILKYNNKITFGLNEDSTAIKVKKCSVKFNVRKDKVLNNRNDKQECLEFDFSNKSKMKENIALEKRTILGFKLKKDLEKQLKNLKK